MKIHEYQAKELLRNYDIPVPRGREASAPEEARRIAQGKISFEQIEALRLLLCSEASNLSSLIGFVKEWPEPCLLLMCKEGLKTAERRQDIQTSFSMFCPRLPYAQ